jgi:hypothetical protein
MDGTRMIVLAKLMITLDQRNYQFNCTLEYWLNLFDNCLDSTRRHFPCVLLFSADGIREIFEEERH